MNIRMKRGAALILTAALLLGALLFYRPAAELAKENAAVR